MSEVYLVKGGQVVRYDLAANAVANTAITVSELWGPLGEPFSSGLDAGLNYGNGKACLFRGDVYVRIDLATNTVETEARSIADSWPGMRDNDFATELDAAVNYGNGTVYFFKGDRIASYDIAEDAVTGVGPLSGWSLAPDGTFESGLSTVVNYGDGNLLFFKGDRYVRYEIATGATAIEVRAVGDYWTGTTVAGFDSALDGSRCTVDPAGTTPATPATPVQPAGNSSYRTGVLRLLDHYARQVESDSVFENEFVSQAVLEATRKAKGIEGRTYTTCVDFQGRIWAVAATNLGLTQKFSVLGVFAKAELDRANLSSALASGRHRGAAQARRHLHVVQPRQRSAQPLRRCLLGRDQRRRHRDVDDVDGGQGTAGTYATDGTKLIQAGAEAILVGRRTYHPDTHLITGSASQGGDARTLDGWVDLDALVN